MTSPNRDNAIAGMADNTSDPRRMMPRPLIRGERCADAWVHGLGIVAGLVGVIALMAVAVRQGNSTLTLTAR